MAYAGESRIDSKRVVKEDGKEASDKENEVSRFSVIVSFSDIDCSWISVVFLNISS